MRKLRIEEVKNRIRKIFPNIEMVGEYKSTKTKTLFYCAECKCKWEAKPENIFSGKGCPICGKKKSINSRTKTSEFFINQIKSLQPNLLIQEEYKGCKIPLKCFCKHCEKIFFATPDALLRGHNSCPVCKKESRLQASEKQKLSHKEFIERLNKISPHIIVLGKYKNYKEHILCKCSLDGNIWEPTPSDLLQGKGCPKCAIRINGEKLRKSEESFRKESKKLNNKIEVLSSYTNQKNKLKVKCKKCGFEWEMLPQNILKGRGCPLCKSSEGEEIITNFLINNKISFLPQKTFEDCKNINLLKFDFYLINYNACIEFDGKQHFEPIEFFGGIQGYKKTQKRDKIKNEYCKIHNIPLLRIPYYEYDNIELKIKDFLRQIK